MFLCLRSSRKHLIMTQHLLFCATIFSLFLPLVLGYGQGAPCIAQNSMKPSEVNHGSPQDPISNPPPLKVFVFTQDGSIAKQYRSSNVYIVKLRGTVPFHGFLLQPRQATELGHFSEKRIGKFLQEEWRQQGIQFQDCDGSNDNAVTHTNGSAKMEVNVKWQSDTAIFPVQFVVTVVFNKTYFWTSYAPETAFLRPKSQVDSVTGPVAKDAEVVKPSIAFSSDRDPCTGVECENGGICRDGKCECQRGWIGETCDQTCPAETCLNGGTCILKSNGHIGCKCIPGYTNWNCDTEIDECESNPCQNGGSCEDKLNGFTCQCPNGYTGPKCHRPCVDVYRSCKRWKDEDRCEFMRHLTKFFDVNCAVTCEQCSYVEETIIDHPPLPPALEAFLFLLGHWTGDMSHNGHFPLNFEGRSRGYSELLKFDVAEVPMFGTPSINYTAYAVAHEKVEDVQVVNGFLTLKRSPETMKEAALMTTSNNGTFECVFDTTPLNIIAGRSALYRLLLEHGLLVIARKRTLPSLEVCLRNIANANGIPGVQQASRDFKRTFSGIITIEEGAVIEGVSMELKSVFNASMPYLVGKIPISSIRKFVVSGKTLTVQSVSIDSDGRTHEYSNTYRKILGRKMY